MKQGEHGHLGLLRIQIEDYDDVDVSDTVAEHGDYFIEGCGCIPQVLSNW